MSWTRPVLSFAQGASITLASTAISCTLALTVEQSAHRLFFWAAPHWYARVDQAYGLSQDDLQYAKLAAVQREIRQVGDLAHHAVFSDKVALLLNCIVFAPPPPTSASESSLTTAAAAATTTSSQAWWNHVHPSTDEERILESAPL